MPNPEDYRMIIRQSDPIHYALSCFASCIKSGERWTSELQQMLDEARDAILKLEMAAKAARSDRSREVSK